MAGIPNFSSDVPNNGYRWWYVDAESDNGQDAVTLILFVGSVFSPYYAWARKRSQEVTAADYCALNVALYGSKKRWAMTERNESSIVRTPHRFDLHNSAVSKTESTITFQIDEWTVPIPRKLRGQITLSLTHPPADAFPIDSQNQHYWQPLAPCARIKVEMESPSLSWEGNAYMDSNFGSCALESTFKQWHWSRAHLPDDTTVVQYDTTELNGHSMQNTWKFNQSSASTIDHVAEHHSLATTPIWRIKRRTRIDEKANLGELRTLEDTPFYARSSYKTTIGNERASCMHESLDLERFSSPWVQCLLPFRMPRRSLSVKRPWNTHNA